MNWVDLCVLLILAVSALLAFLRGFVREVLGLAAWIGAVALAFQLFPAAAPEARRLIGNPEIADPIAAGVLFLVSLIVLSIIAGIVARGIRGLGLGGLDRTIGLLFGVLRGAVLVAATYIGAGLLFSVAQWPGAVLQARSLPFAYQGARWIADQLPPRFALRVQTPPGPPTRASDLLQPAPHGYALGGPHPEEDR